MSDHLLSIIFYNRTQVCVLANNILRFIDVDALFSPTETVNPNKPISEYPVTYFLEKML